MPAAPRELPPEPESEPEPEPENFKSALTRIAEALAPPPDDGERTAMTIVLAYEPAIGVALSPAVGLAVAVGAAVETPV
jgi:hypothetical protein